MKKFKIKPTLAIVFPALATIAIQPIIFAIWFFLHLLIFGGIPVIKEMIQDLHKMSFDKVYQFIGIIPYLLLIFWNFYLVFGNTVIFIVEKI